MYLFNFYFPLHNFDKKLSRIGLMHKELIIVAFTHEYFTTIEILHNLHSKPLKTNNIIISLSPSFFTLTIYTRNRHRCICKNKKHDNIMFCIGSNPSKCFIYLVFFFILANLFSSSHGDSHLNGLHSQNLPGMYIRKKKYCKPFVICMHGQIKL